MATYGESLHWAVAVVDWAEANNVSLDGEALSLFPGVEIVFWARNRADLVTIEDIRNRWNVSRATAFRWRAALKPAKSQPDPDCQWSTKDRAGLAARVVAPHEFNTISLAGGAATP